MNAAQDELTTLRARCNRLEIERADAERRAVRAEERAERLRKLYVEAMAALDRYRDTPTVPRELVAEP